MESSLYHLISSAQNFQACRYVGLAGYVIYMYDFLITYSEVQRLIWPSPMGVVKACYYFNRLLVPIGLTINTVQMSGLTRPLSTTFCVAWIATAGYMEIISLGVSNMILLLRVYALYGQSKRVLFGLLAFFVASYITIMVTTTLSVVAVKDHVHYSPVVKACVVDNKPPILASIWAGSIVVEVLIFCMTLYKGIEHARKAKLITKSPILHTLYRDGLVYFIVIMVIKLFNLLVWCFGDKTLILLGIYFIWGVVTALVSRLLLNLRGVENAARWGETSILPPPAYKTEGSTFMQTGWFERTRNGKESIFTTADDRKGGDDYWEEGLGLAAGTNNIYPNSIERKALQRRDQEMKERRAMEMEKWREQQRVLQIVPKYGPSYPPNDFSESILVIGRDDKFVGDDETIAEPTSAQSEEFATMPYDQSLGDSHPDRFSPVSGQRRSRKPQRSPRRDDSQEVEVIRRESFLPSPNTFRANRNSNTTILGPNIERLVLRTRSGGVAVGRLRSSGPGNTGRLPISPNSRTPQFPPRHPPL